MLLCLKHRLVALIVSLTLVLSIAAKAMASDLPANLKVVLISKLVPYEQNFAKKPSLSIFVVGNQAVFQSFQLLKAKQQNQQLGDIQFGEDLPKEQFDIVYLDGAVNLSDALIYSLKHNSLLVTDDITRVKQGITLGLSVKNGRPMFFLNKRSSDAAGLQWDKTVLDIATLYN